MIDQIINVGEYVTFKDIKKRTGFSSRKTDSTLKSAVSNSTLKTRKSWVFHADVPKWHETSVYYLSETSDPGGIVSYPYMEFPLNRSDPQPFKGAYGESKQVFYNWRKRMLALGLIEMADIKPSQPRPRKRSKFVPFESYLKCPIAKRWLLAMLREIRDIKS